MDKVRKNIYTVLLSLTCMVLMLGCSFDSDKSMDRIKKAGSINIAMSSGYSPFCFYSYNNELIGYDVDIAKEIAKRLGVKPKIIDTDWKDIIKNLNAGLCDIIVSSMTVTDERMMVVSFSVPYYHTKSYLVVQKDSLFKSRSDFTGKTIGVEDGTMFENDAKTLNGVIIRKFKSSDQALIALEKNLVDAVITDEIVANYVIYTKKLSLEIFGEPLRRDKVAVALRKGDDALLKKVNEALKNMLDDGTLRRLSAKIIENRYQ